MLCNRLRCLHRRVGSANPLSLTFPASPFPSTVSTAVASLPSPLHRVLSAPFGSPRLRPPSPSQPLPDAGTFNSRRARRAAQFGHPNVPRAGVSGEGKSQRREEEKEGGKTEAKPRSYDKMWTTVTRGPPPQRPSPQGKEQRNPNDGGRASLRSAPSVNGGQQGGGEEGGKPRREFNGSSGVRQPMMGSSRAKGESSAAYEEEVEEEDDVPLRPGHRRSNVSPTRASGRRATQDIEGVDDEDYFIQEVDDGFSEAFDDAPGPPPRRPFSQGKEQRIPKEGGRARFRSSPSVKGEQQGGGEVGVRPRRGFNGTSGVRQPTMGRKRTMGNSHGVVEEEMEEQDDVPLRPSPRRSNFPQTKTSERRATVDNEGVYDEDYVIQDGDDGFAEAFDDAPPITDRRSRSIPYTRPPRRSSPLQQRTVRSPSITAAPSPPAPTVSGASVSLVVPPALRGPPLVVDGYSFAFCTPPVVTPHLLELSQLTSIPIVPHPPPTDFSLQYGSAGRSLAIRQGNSALPLVVKWHSRMTGVENTPLVRALGWKYSPRAEGSQWKDQPLQGLTVFDATAGKGKDAYLAACAGAQVFACERHPALFALLSHTRQRCMADAAAVKVRPRLARLHLLYGDALNVLPSLPTPSVPQPDVVYIDTGSSEYWVMKAGGKEGVVEAKAKDKVERLLSIPSLALDGHRRSRSERLEEAAREEAALIQVARKVAKWVVVKRRKKREVVEEREERWLKSYNSPDYEYVVLQGTKSFELNEQAVLDQEMQRAEDHRDI